jgi:DNA-damage-inducible protein J
MDSQVKEQAQQLFAEFGLDMTTAVNMFLRQSIRLHGIPFDLRLEVPNAETIAAIEDVKNNRNMSRTFDNFEDLISDLNA